MSADVLKFARRYLELGYHPIPVEPRGKKPIVSWKAFQETQPTLELVNEWWSRYPDAGIGLVLGRGTFAVDLDGGKDAEDILAAKGVSLPGGAPRSKTGSGFHVLLRSSKHIPDCVDMFGNGGKPQVDIRGVGIIVAPPSIHYSGAKYSWLIPPPFVGDIPQAPPELEDLIIDEQPVAKDALAGDAIDWVSLALNGVKEGGRDATCARLAGYLLGKGLAPAVVKCLLNDSYGSKCVPPFPVDEISKTVDSIARREGVHSQEVRPVSLYNLILDCVTQLDNPPDPSAPTPHGGLNELLNGGFRAAQLTYLGAVPGAGKSAFALQIGFHSAKQGRKVLMISAEMGMMELAQRIIAQQAKVNASHVLRKELNEDERKRIWQFAKDGSAVPFYFTEAARTVEEIKSMASDMSLDSGLDFLIVDYLQLLRSASESRERRHEIESISRDLKLLAMSLKIPVLVISSITVPRAGAKVRIGLGSLRESGNLDYDADVVMLLDKEDDKQEVECRIVKNRSGRTGSVEMYFEKDILTLSEKIEQVQESLIPAGGVSEEIGY